MNDIKEEEIKTINALDNTWKGVTDIMKITNVGYYRTLSILQDFIKQKVVEMKEFGKYDKYRKINHIYSEDSPATSYPLVGEVSQ